MRRELLVAALLALLPVAPAYGTEVRISEAIDGAGHPVLAAAISPAEEQDGELEWRRCAGGGTVCEPLPESAYARIAQGVRVVRPGETPAGTVFEAVATKAGVETVTRTRPWQGAVSPIAPPTLQGQAAYGKTVTVGSGAWAGGWPPPSSGVDGSRPTILACREPAGGECWVIGGGTAVLEPRWTGWYLLAQQVVSPSDPYCAVAQCPVSVSAMPPPLPQRSGLQPAGPLVGVSAPLGPIAPPVVKASIRARALRSKGQLLVGRVDCEVRCSVQLKVSGGHRPAVYPRLTVTGAKALTVPMRHGKLTVRVLVDGKLLAMGTSRAR